MTPVSKIICKVLVEYGVWGPGHSKTTHITDYTKKFFRQSWQFSRLHELTDDVVKKIKKEIKQRLEAEGHTFDRMYIVHAKSLLILGVKSKRGSNNRLAVERFGC